MDNQEQHLVRRRRASVEEMVRLSHAEIQPADFFKAFLGRLLQAFEAEGGSLWLQNNATRDQVTPLIQSQPPEGMEELQSENVQNVVLRTLDSTKPLLIAPDRAIAAAPQSTAEDAYLDYLTLMCVPFVVDNDSTGCFFAYRTQPSADNFTPDDIYHAQNLLTYVSIYLLNHRLKTVETATKRLDAVTKLSEEFLTTLDEERVCIAAVNLGAEVVQYDRCSISLGYPGALKLVAVTKQDLVEAKSVMARKICEVSEHFLARGEPTLVTRKTLGQIEDEDSRRSIEEYLELTGMETTYSIPMKTGERTLGVMLFESYSEGAFDERSIHNMGYLGAHTVRALGRSHQYSSLPMIKGWEALSRARGRVQAMPRHKRYIISGLILTAILALIFMPWGYSVSGDCVVEVSNARFVYAPFDKAALKEMLVKEGDYVREGQIIAKLDDEPLQNQRQSLITSRNAAKYRMNVAENIRDVAEKNRQKLMMLQYDIQIDLVKEQIRKCNLRSPIEGTVLTKNLEQLEGRVVDTTSRICQVASTREMRITVQVPEEKMSDIYENQPATTVITTFAGEEIEGKVSVVPQESTPGMGGKNVFLVEIPLANEDGKYKPGMMGKTKLHSGTRALGEVIFGDIWHFIKTKLGFD